MGRGERLGGGGRVVKKGGEPAFFSVTPEYVEHGPSLDLLK